MSEASLRTEALQQYLALDWGLIGLPNVKLWADERILSHKDMDSRVHDISLSNNINDAFSSLEALSKGGDFSLALRSIFEQVLSIDEITPDRASELARKIYFLGMNEDLPREIYSLIHHWDQIDLALDGTSGDQRAATQAFLNDLAMLSK